VDLLIAKYPAESVAVYLNAFNQFNQAGWANLDEILKSDPRLKLGEPAA
jgi:NADPH-dependent 7-cyano-7-deazaguanine reductase QueF-like protein